MMISRLRDFFRNASINRKLNIIVMLASSLVLVVACLIFVAYDHLDYKKEMVTKLIILADVIGNNSKASLAFQDEISAKETLSGLRAEQHVLSASLYRIDGTLFTSYHRGQRAEPRPYPALRDGEHRFEQGRLALCRTIMLDQEAIGNLYIEFDTVELENRLMKHFGVLAFIMALCSIIAYLVTSKLQRIICRPILELAAASGLVTRNNDYSIRAVRSTNDEIGYLTDQFNDMMIEIQKRDHALRDAHTQIENKALDLQQELKERRRAEAALEERTRELARSNGELEQFAYVASHDLQEPLRMITSYLQLLSKRYKGKLDADADDFIHYAVNGAKRMRCLIDDLLMYSRLGKGNRAFASTDCGVVYQDSLKNLQIAIDESRAVVTADPLPSLMADRGQLTQLFQNLIGNAVKFHSEKEPRVHVASSRENGCWHFSVRDNGIGIPPEQQGKIFTIFSRVHDREKYPGSGIGLAVCKKIVERHGGRIWVESVPDQGSTFHFTVACKGEPS